MNWKMRQPCMEHNATVLMCVCAQTEYRCTMLCTCLAVFLACVGVHVWESDRFHTAAEQGHVGRPSGRRFPFPQTFFLRRGTQVHNCIQLEDRERERGLLLDFLTKHVKVYRQETIVGRDFIASHRDSPSIYLSVFFTHTCSMLLPPFFF